MSRVAVLVDAGYLFKAGGQLLAARDVRREELVLDANVALKVLAETSCTLTARELLRVYWYDAAVGSAKASHREIAQQAHLKLRLGHLNSAGEQKGVDPLIIMDMITLSQNRACDEMVLLSGDADLIVGMLQAQERGVRVHLLGVTPSRANQSPLLREEADTCSEWGSEVLSTFLRLASAEEIQARLARVSIAASKGGLAAASLPPDNSAKTPPTGRASLPPNGSVVSPLPKPPVVSAAPASIDVGLLATVVDAVLPQLLDSEKQEIRSSARPGVVPGGVDRKLMGTAKHMLNTMLMDDEKRVLRRLLYDRCQGEKPEA